MNALTFTLVGRSPMMLAFESQLLIAAIWTALENLESLDSQRQRDLRSRRS